LDLLTHFLMVELAFPVTSARFSAESRRLVNSKLCRPGFTPLPLDFTRDNISNREKNMPRTHLIAHQL